MPAKSKKQQMAAGAALSAKRGERSKASLRGASRSMVKSMTQSELKELAETKRKRLPVPRRQETKVTDPATSHRHGWLCLLSSTWKRCRTRWKTGARMNGSRDQNDQAGHQRVEPGEYLGVRILQIVEHAHPRQDHGGVHERIGQTHSFEIGIACHADGETDQVSPAQSPIASPIRAANRRRPITRSVAMLQPRQLG